MLQDFYTQGSLEGSADELSALAEFDWRRKSYCTILLPCSHSIFKAPTAFDRRRLRCEGLRWLCISRWSYHSWLHTPIFFQPPPSEAGPLSISGRESARCQHCCSLRSWRGITLNERAGTVIRDDVGHPWICQILVLASLSRFCLGKMVFVLHLGVGW